MAYTAVANKPTPDSDESVLLRDWDIDRFFEKSESSHKKRLASGDFNRNSASGRGAVPRSDEIKPRNTFLSSLFENSKNHRRQESDSKLSLNFVRGFRRENSDFFPLSKRHSAILGERQSTAVNVAPHRSSAIYSKKKLNNGEPILTDFVSREYVAISKNDNSNDSENNSRHAPFVGPRREKTESVILLRNSTNRNLPIDQQQVTIINKILYFERKMRENKMINLQPLSVSILNITYY